MTPITNLLRKASLIAERENAIKSEALQRGEEFNVFRLCKVDHYENLHSAILSELLNPTGSHGQEDLFLRLFLKTIDEPLSQVFHTNKALVATEYAIENGRLDIFIDDMTGNAIIIENKLYADDQDAQLMRYAEYANNKSSLKQFLILYLTLDGHEAKDKSANGVKYTPISYQSTVLKWIEDCIREVYDKPFLRETLIQYELHIKQLTRDTMNKGSKKELVEAMVHEPEGVAAIINAQDEWEKVILENSLFIPLREYAKARGMGFSINNRFWMKSPWGRLEFTLAPNLKIVFEYEHQGRNSFYYGIVDTRDDRPERQLLPGLYGGNDDWRYGWCYLDNHKDWTINDLAEIAQDKGVFLQHICDIVNGLYKEMKIANII
ncbi:MAG: PD-(D/E)XK nuclease family protein [Bacteroidales bacterium]|nr:PD-(D/E)XK nuclease family protein [Bacteroidales bacterium]